MDFKFFDTLKALIEKISVKLDIKDSFKFWSDNKTVHLHLDGNQSKEIVFDGNPIKVNPRKLDKDQAETLLGEVVRPAVDDGDSSLLTPDAAKLLEDYRAHTDEGKDVLGALRSLIPPEDFLALRASFFVRLQYRGGKDIARLKDDIVNKFGARGLIAKTISE